MRIKRVPVWNAPGEGTPAAGEDQAQVPAGDAGGVAGDAAAAPPASLIGSETTPAAETAAPAFEAWTSEHLTPVIPDGFTVTDDQSARLISIINDNKGDLSGTVKGLLSYYTELASEASTALAEQFNSLQTRMQDEVKNDPTFGGEKLTESLRVSKEVATRFGGADFLQMLSVTGAGNSLAMVRFLNEVAKFAPAEGKPVTGAPSAPPKTLEARLWGGAPKS